MRALLVVLLVATASEAAAECPSDAQLTKLADDALAESVRYLGALEKRTARWKTACEAARKDLVALEPDAKRFVTAMKAFVTRSKQMPPECRKRLVELGEKRPLAQALDNRTAALKTRVDPQLDGCKDHPGFTDAVTKGLRVMKRKQR